MVITESIKVPGRAVINGILHGELAADELEVGRDGHLTGEVCVNKADIHGQVHESLVAREHLILRSTGRIHGKAAYGQIEVERGGRVDGMLGPLTADRQIPLPLAQDGLLPAEGAADEAKQE